MRRRRRFAGAGGSAEREFNRLRRQNIREAWHVWLGLVALFAAFAVWSFYAEGAWARMTAALAGFLAGAAFVMWALGGHVSAFRWWLGAEGERDTAKEIERLGLEWHCEHDLEHEHGNWDHVLVGPSGVFLLDSKILHGTAAAAEDRLRSGRLVFPGSRFRGSARTVKQALERRLGERAPWVQAVVVVWGDFPQGEYEERDVVYLAGERLRSWLEGRASPERLNAPKRAALVTALREVRAELAGRGS
jgi:hypothetical protein